jgi:hypothetical protein
MTETSDDASREGEPWLAFELLLAWAEAVVRQRTRLEIARSRLARPSRARSTDELGIEAREKRFASRSYDTECHLFIDAAWQLIRYSKRIPLAIVGHDAFRELDNFELDVTALKDGALEYLTGGGHRPDGWICEVEDGVSDAVAAGHSKLVGRLNYIAFTEMAERLTRRLYEIDPNSRDFTA